MRLRYGVPGLVFALLLVCPAFAFVDASAGAGGWGVMDGDEYWPGDWVESWAIGSGSTLIQDIWEGESSGNHSESGGQSCSLPGWQNGVAASAGDALHHGTVNTCDMGNMAGSGDEKELDWEDVGVHSFHRWADAEAHAAGGGATDDETANYDVEGTFEVLGWGPPGPDGAPQAETDPSLYGGVLDDSEQS